MKGKLFMQEGCNNIYGTFGEEFWCLGFIGINARIGAFV